MQTNTITTGMSSTEDKLTAYAKADNKDEFGRTVSTTVASYVQKREYNYERGDMISIDSMLILDLVPGTQGIRVLRYINQALRGGKSGNVVMDTQGRRPMYKEVMLRLDVSKSTAHKILKLLLDNEIIALIEDDTMMMVNPFIAHPTTISKAKAAQLQQWWLAVVNGDTDNLITYTDVFTTVAEDALEMLGSIAETVELVQDGEVEKSNAQKYSDRMFKEDPKGTAMALILHAFTLYNNKSNKAFRRAVKERNYSHVKNYLNRTELPLGMKVLPKIKAFAQDIVECIHTIHKK